MVDFSYEEVPIVILADKVLGVVPAEEVLVVVLADEVFIEAAKLLCFGFTSRERS